jgi:hypothetical protein
VTVSRPAFLITIDTEGDNLWSSPREITTRNSGFLSRFQSLCERHGFKPTYVTAWEMACCPVFQEFAREVLKRVRGEIGMHLHAWNSPPLAALTDDDYEHQPYLIEYPEQTMREKVRTLTEKLEDTFAVKMLTHRAGRWSFNACYARILLDSGYRVDCSVTPHVSWASHRGNPRGRGGADYSCYPEGAYFIDPDDISRPGSSELLEVPMTILPLHWPAPIRAARRVFRGVSPLRRAMRRFFPVVSWLRPSGRNRRGLLNALSVALREDRDYVEFMLHSSELMPGGSPMFPRSDDIERLYDDMEALFDAASRSFEGLTLQEYYDRYRAQASGGREGKR